MNLSRLGSGWLVCVKDQESLEEALVARLPLYS